MIDINMISNYLVIPVVLACCVVGFVIKTYTRIPNRFIPLIMLFLGTIINIFITHDNGLDINMSTLIGGAVSGLASSGSYELVMNTFKLKK